MKYSTQILLFLLFLTVGFIGYTTYQIFMSEQDIVQSNIVFNIHDNVLNKKPIAKLPAVNYALLSDDDIINLVNDKMVSPSMLLENVYLAETANAPKTLTSWNGWNGLLAKVFGLYMDWIGKGSKMQKFSTQMATELSPYYDAKKCDLKKVNFGYAPRLKEKLNSPHLGITDGYRIMFGDEKYVKTFANAKKLTALSDGEVYWMAHELTHCEQYAGNRNKYAVRWFNELFDHAAAGFIKDFRKALKKAILTLDFDPIIVILAPEKLSQYDDNMPLEIEAYEKGMKVVGEVSKLRAKEQTKVDLKLAPISNLKLKIVVPIKINP